MRNICRTVIKLPLKVFNVIICTSTDWWVTCSVDCRTVHGCASFHPLWICRPCEHFVKVNIRMQLLQAQFVPFFVWPLSRSKLLEEVTLASMHFQYSFLATCYQLGLRKNPVVCFWGWLSQPLYWIRKGNIFPQSLLFSFYFCWTSVGLLLLNFIFSLRNGLVTKLWFYRNQLRRWKHSLVGCTKAWVTYIFSEVSFRIRSHFDRSQCYIRAV